MHELGVIMTVCDRVIAFAKENNIPRVDEIVLEIGEGSGIISEYVEKVWPAAIRHTMMENTKLIIETVPGMAMCEDCFEIYNVVENKGCCPQCGSQVKEILSGTDFNIKEIHIYEDEASPSGDTSNA